MDYIDHNFMEVITAQVEAATNQNESTTDSNNISTNINGFNALHTEICSHLENFVNKSLNGATNMRDNFFKDYNFSHLCDNINNTIADLLARNPQIEAAIERSGKSPVIAISLLLLLLLFSLIFIFVCKAGGKKSNKISKIDTNQSKATFPLEKTSKSIGESISPASSPKSVPQSQLQQLTSSSTNSKSTGNANSNVTKNGIKNNSTPTDKSNLLLDVDGFVLRLRQTGFKVERIKNGTSKDQILRLNAKGDMLWSSSFFTKSQNITTLISSFEADGSGFILEFRKKVIHFKLKDSELPYNAASMIKYFNGIVKKQAITPNYVLAICKSQTGHHDNDINDDAASEISESTNVVNGGTISTNPNGFSPYHNRNPRSATSARPALPMSPGLATVKEEIKY